MTKNKRMALKPQYRIWRSWKIHFNQCHLFMPWLYHWFACNWFVAISILPHQMLKVYYLHWFQCLVSVHCTLCTFFCVFEGVIIILCYPSMFFVLLKINSSWCVLPTDTIWFFVPISHSFSIDCLLILATELQSLGISVLT